MFHTMDHDGRDAVIGVDLGSLFNVTRQLIAGMRVRAPRPRHRSSALERDNTRPIVNAPGTYVLQR